MKRLIVLLVLLAIPTTAHADDRRWWQSFYARVGQRDMLGVHAWSGRTVGFGYRYTHGWWGIDASILNMQYGGHHEGTDTAATLLLVADFDGLLGTHAWLAGGFSAGRTVGYVDSFLAKREGRGFQAEAVLGWDLPRRFHLPLFVQLGVTMPLYRMYDRYRSPDTPVYAVAVEGALGVRF